MNAENFGLATFGDPISELMPFGRVPDVCK